MVDETIKKGFEIIDVGGKKVYLKKGIFGYRIVYPIKNEDGSYNWTNLLFGGNSNLVKLLIYIGIAVLIYFGFHDMMYQCEQLANQYAAEHVVTNELPKLLG